MNFKKIILSISLLVLGVIAYFGFQVYQIVFTPNTTFSEDKVSIFIPTNANFEEVKKIVSPYINDMDKFETLANRRGYSSQVKAGKFELTKNMNSNAIVSALRRSIPVRVTFNNQERLENFAGRIAMQIEADSIHLLQAFKDPKFLDENGFTEETVFTLLLPNTFEFYWDTSAEKFRNQMVKEYYRFWNDERKAKAEQLGLTPVQVSILASIVHKETSKIEERPKVAKVYLNRLAMGMPLQADPTVIFAYKLASNDFNQVIKRVYYKHLEVESPYNTYRKVGLPPGPIFMADINAIDAVLNPEQHDFIYFCASVERFGYHEFATTLADHNVNAKKYAAWLNAQTGN
ncbi:endolytic transglycosylase MltG [Flavobacterium sp.]|uniref:endolytic transglycosylase MltG n=1 Tax=Flavobacterium sp. TaxID=239 RepID=UPI0035287CD4